MVTVQEAIDSLLAPDLARIQHQFDLGEAAFARVRGHENLYIGVHMEQLIHMEQLVKEGRWSVCRKLVTT